MPRTKSNVTNLLMLVLVGAASGLLIRMASLPGEGCHAEPEDSHGAQANAPAEDAEVKYAVGNEKCPVMGGGVDPEDPLVVVHGIGIGICCPGCDGDIEKDVPGILTKLLADPKAGPGLKAWLDENPDVKKEAGLVDDQHTGHKEEAKRPPAPERRMTALRNGTCPIDDKPARDGHDAATGGMLVRTCSAGCKDRVEKGPEPALTALSRDPAARTRIEAHANLEERGGHGPHFACAACKVRSAGDGPCPECGQPMKRSASEPDFDLANPRCPIMGEEIPEDGGSSFVHDGLVVRICCPSCEATFKQHPGYYLAKIEREQGIRVPRLATGAGR